MKTLCRFLAVVGLGLLIVAILVLLLSVWDVLPWFGLGGKLFLTCWTSGMILGLGGAVGS